MGFFSANCEGCGHPLLCVQATNDVNAWMNLAVAITADGSVLKGSYDGYGALTSPGGPDYEYAVGMDTTVWHQSCWTANGSPSDYRGASAAANDQGWFFVEGDHDMSEPGRSSPRSGIVISHQQLIRWAGRELIDSDVARIEKALPHSSIPDAINEIASSLDGD